MSFPILLRPKLFAIRNIIKGRDLISVQSARDMIVLGLAVSVMAMIFRGARWALVHINAQPDLLYLSPQYPLGMILTLLFFMLLLSSIATAIGSMFLSDDLDLVLSSPLSIPRFFFNKLVYIILSTCWMPLIFIIPLLLAFGVAYQAPPVFYLLCPIVLFPYFVIPASLAMVIAICITRFLPPNRSREALFLVVILFLGIIGMVADLARLAFSSLHGSHNLMRLVSFLSLADVDWLPSNWIATLLDSLIRQGEIASPVHLVLTFCVALAMTSLAHLGLRFFHFDAYTRAKNHRKLHSTQSTVLRRVLSSLFSKDRKPLVALISKDLLSFVRDVTHMVQLVMLLGLCMVYVFNLRVFMALDTLPYDSQAWWKSFFFVSNCCIAAFVTTGFCTRFVFVSISLEGRAFWLVHSSPLTIGEILRAKFSCWYFPVACLTSFVFSAAAIATGVSPGLIGMSIIVSWIVCYGIVGLAVGLGARFANFTWEHASQLAVGFGNMVFMLLSIALISLNLVPISYLLFTPAPDLLYGSRAVNQSLWYAVVVIGVLYLNVWIARFSLKSGERVLSRRIETVAG